jgi:group I intron endonuclease
MLINKALLKYGYSGFKLDILEYCNKDEAVAREQYYLDLLNPEYNTLKKAGSTLGAKRSFASKHSAETIAKFKEMRKNKVVSEETRAKLSENNLNRSLEYKEKLRALLLKRNLAKGHPIEVINISTNEKTIYPTIRQATLALDVSHVSIGRVLKSNKLLKGIFKISYLSNNE